MEASVKDSMEAMEAFMEAMEASMEAVEAATEAFMNFHEKKQVVQETVPAFILCPFALLCDFCSFWLSFLRVFLRRCTRFSWVIFVFVAAQTNVI